jgi:2-keto-4-pentenoate hydratase/2-oxohepta-3-ene-1,7-dioic acid hydratase in catechol pathway
VVVIGRRCKNVSREQALDFVLGYTCANDVSVTGRKEGRRPVEPGKIL